MLIPKKPISDYTRRFSPFCWSCRVHFMNTKAFTSENTFGVGDPLASKFHSKAVMKKWRGKGAPKTSKIENVDSMGSTIDGT